MKYLCALIVCTLGLSVSASASVAKVLELEGKVGVAQSAKGPYKALTKEMELPVGVYVRSGKDAKAVLKFEDESVLTVHELSIVHLRQMDKSEKKSKHVFFLLMGKLWAKVKKEDSSDKSFTIQTPAAIAAVRGTAFSVTSDPETKDATIGVWDGVVGVKGAAKDAGKEEVQVMAGFRIEVLYNKAPDPNALKKIEQAMLRERQQFEEQLAGMGLLDAIAPGVGETVRIDNQRTEEARNTIREANQALRGEKRVNADFDILQRAVALLYRDTEYMPGKDANERSGAETFQCLLENKDHEGKEIPKWNGPYIDSNFLDPYGKEYCVFHFERGGRLMGIKLHSNGPDKVGRSHDDHVRLITMGRMRGIMRNLDKDQEE